MDILIARSIDGGATFPADQVLHIRDQDLGDALNARQVLPAITVDSNGGVNLVCYSVTNPTDSVPPIYVYQPKYARVASFLPTYPHPTIIWLPLATPFDMQVTGLPRPEFIGDYVMIDARGCTVYVGFASRHEGGAVSVYVSKIQVSQTCAVAADVNVDEQVNTTDASVYSAWFAAGDPRADLNHDGAVIPQTSRDSALPMPAGAIPSSGGQSLTGIRTAQRGHSPRAGSPRQPSSGTLPLPSLNGVPPDEGHL
jgi:hypothetical protein